MRSVGEMLTKSPNIRLRAKANLLEPARIIKELPPITDKELIDGNDFSPIIAERKIISDDYHCIRDMFQRKSILDLV